MDKVEEKLIELGFERTDIILGWANFTYERNGFKLKVYKDYNSIWGMEINDMEIPRGIFNNKIIPIVISEIRKFKLNKILNNDN